MKLYVRHEILVSAPARDAWHVLGVGFGNICDWAGGLTASSIEGELGVGAVRSCTGSGWGPFPAGVVTEKLTAFDQEAMTFGYIATSGLPWFLRAAGNTWSIDALTPETSRVRFEATLEGGWWLRPLGVFVPWLFKSSLKRLGEEMKHSIEHGTPHPRKLAEIQQVV